MPYVTGAHSDKEASMLELYYAPHTCALASHIALEEAGADYRPRRVDLAGGEQRRPEYLAINPKGRVPALVTDRGILTETPAILLFVAQTHPAARLAPLDDPFELARINSFCSYLCSTVHVAHAHRLRGYRWADDPAALEAMKRKVPQTVGEAFALIEREMFAGPWVMGEQYTLCDPYLFTIAGWLESDGVDPATLPRVLDHRRRMAERPAVAAVLAAQSAAAA
jgi:glutathione S-transferase